MSINGGSDPAPAYHGPARTAADPAPTPSDHDPCHERDLVAPLGKRTAATRSGGARPCGRMDATIASTTPCGDLST